MPSHPMSCEALPGRGRTWAVPVAPSPCAEVGAVGACQPQASRDLHFCDQELPALAKVMVMMCPGFLLKTSKCDFLFFFLTKINNT